MFPVNPRLKDRLDSWCRECRNKMRRVSNLAPYHIAVLRRKSREFYRDRVVVCEHCGSIISGSEVRKAEVEVQVQAQMAQNKEKV